MLIFEGGGKIGRYVGGYHDARGQQEQYVALKTACGENRRSRRGKKQKL
ncbi:hypothetical protein ACP0HM_01460 [Escherichia coli]